jgi:hypothetical protein
MEQECRSTTTTLQRIEGRIQAVRDHIQRQGLTHQGVVQTEVQKVLNVIKAGQTEQQKRYCELRSKIGEVFGGVGTIQGDCNTLITQQTAAYTSLERLRITLRVFMAGFLVVLASFFRVQVSAIVLH